MSAERFDALYQRNARDLLGYFVRRTASTEDAADCLSETLLVAWSKHDAIPSEAADARPWVFGIARNVLRRLRERETNRSDAVDALASELRGARATVPADDPGTAALRLLSPIDREIIEMLAWDQLAPREISAILGLSANVVRIRAHRARHKLREALQAAAVHDAVSPAGTSIAGPGTG